ncbi:hypothetical protein ANCCEY_13758 [Ancylostoma ceylanicum]|uniref:Uncharacterized protein n=1 Tax=Ancylostoma ceylanicum TaxID=53326 RepID=A0A0D6L828_9BILA|nr:hypothetical protein ANCCEY_13758 [Ancylostoma ceylanicum]
MLDWLHFVDKISCEKRVILYANTLIRFLLPRQSGCDALPSLIGCFFMRLPLNCSMFMVASSTFMIAVERSLSTAKLSNYEENRRIGPILVILQVNLFRLKAKLNWEEASLHPHQFGPELGEKLIRPFSRSINGLSDYTELAINYYIIKIATSLREHPDLRARYNVDENLRTITIVFPFCAATCLFTSCFFSLLICVIALNASMDYPTLFTLIDGSLLLPEFALILPLIIDRMTKIVAEKSKLTSITETSRLSTSYYYNC